jgi:hypothetical protein
MNECNFPTMLSPFLLIKATLLIYFCQSIFFISSLSMKSCQYFVQALCGMYAICEAMFCGYSSALIFWTRPLYSAGGRILLPNRASL